MDFSVIRTVEDHKILGDEETMRFEQLKDGANVAMGVVELIYNFDQMAESVKHSKLMRKKTQLMEKETELMKKRVYEQQRAYLQERRKTSSEFESAIQLFKEGLDNKLETIQEVKKANNRNRISKIKLSFTRE
jgi:soluble cytochrome b562